MILADDFKETNSAESGSIVAVAGLKVRTAELGKHIGRYRP